VDDLATIVPACAPRPSSSVRHPLVEAGFRKADIRLASRALELDTWDRPASPCLSSRFPYGTRSPSRGCGASPRREDALRAEGFRELRVRYHDRVARIELPLAEAGGSSRRRGASASSARSRTSGSTASRSTCRASAAAA
jgi:uncharacterized protein